jgi:hypothetical protein
MLHYEFWKSFAYPCVCLKTAKIRLPVQKLYFWLCNRTRFDILKQFLLLFSHNMVIRDWEKCTIFTSENHLLFFSKFQKRAFFKLNFFTFLLFKSIFQTFHELSLQKLCFYDILTYNFPFDVRRRKFTVVFNFIWIFKKSCFSCKNLKFWLYSLVWINLWKK